MKCDVKDLQKLPKFGMKNKTMRKWETSRHEEDKIQANKTNESVK